MWDLIKDGSFFTMLQEAFMILDKFPPERLRADYERLLYKGISIRLPIEFYYRLCLARFNQTVSKDEKYYFANCAIRAYKKSKFSKLRKTYAESYKQLIPYYVKHYRAKYETLYGEEITELLTKNLSKKMSSLPRATIIARNAAISVGMLKKNKKGAPEE